MYVRCTDTEYFSLYFLHALASSYSLIIIIKFNLIKKKTQKNEKFIYKRTFLVFLFTKKNRIKGIKWRAPFEIFIFYAPTRSSSTISFQLQNTTFFQKEEINKQKGKLKLFHFSHTKYIFKLLSIKQLRKTITGTHEFSINSLL